MFGCNIFEEIGEKPRLDAVRMSKHVRSKVWPVKVTLSSSSAAHNLFFTFQNVAPI